MEKQIHKHKKKSKNGKLKYRVNMNTLTGNMASVMADLLSKNPEKRQLLLAYLQNWWNPIYHLANRKSIVSTQ